MRKFLASVTAAAAMSLPATALADGAGGPASQPVAVAPEPVAATQPRSEKLICRMMYHEGMLMKTSMCKTQQEWDEERRRGEREIQKFQNRSYVH